MGGSFIGNLYWCFSNFPVTKFFIVVSVDWLLVTRFPFSCHAMVLSQAIKKYVAATRSELYWCFSQMVIITCLYFRDGSMRQWPIED